MLADMRNPTYADLRWVTANSACGVNLDDLYHKRVIGCDAFGRPGIGYPPMSIWLFRIIQFDAGWTNLLALACGLSFIAVSGYVFSKFNKNTAATLLVGGLLLWSYPVQIGLEKLNIDIIVYILVILDCYLISLSTAPWRAATSLAIVTSTVGMKIYPLFGYLGLLFLSKPIARPGLSWLRLNKLDAVIILTGCTIAMISATPILFGNAALPAGSVSAGQGGLGSHGLKALGFFESATSEIVRARAGEMDDQRSVWLKDSKHYHWLRHHIQIAHRGRHQTNDYKHIRSTNKQIYRLRTSFDDLHVARLLCNHNLIRLSGNISDSIDRHPSADLHVER